MKKKREIRWTQSVGDSQWKEQGRDVLRTVFAGTPLFAICTTVFFCAAYLMIKDSFDWGAPGIDNLFRVLLLAVVVSVVMEARTLFGPRLRRWLPLGVFLVGGFLFSLYLRFTASGEQIISGLQTICSEFLRDWNIYYGTTAYVPAGDADFVEPALDFVMLALCFLLTWTGKLIKEPMLPAAAPLLVFVAELLVGYSPEGWGVLLLFAGLLLSNTGGFGKPEFSVLPGGTSEETKKRMLGLRFVPVAGVILLCILVKAIGSEKAEEIATDGGAKFSEWQTAFMSEVTGWEIWDRLKAPEPMEELTEKLFEEDDATRAELSNDTPQYDNVPVLQVTLEHQPYGNLYFVGFYADEYKDGLWTGSHKAFEKACKKAGYDSETVARELAELGLLALATQEETMGAAEIVYCDADGANAYVPYFSYIDSEVAETEGDFRFVKKKGTEKLLFALWQFGSEYTAYLSEADARTEKEWEAWYEDYVESQYLTVPKGLDYVETLAEELRQSGVSRGLIGNSEYINEERLNKAYLVAEWLRSNTSYSLRPGELPKGADPIEYFLETGRSGYCMHYASAATMLLRKLEVPARYVSGYVAQSSMFFLSADGFEAIVPDNKAHAWTEIYLEGIGWIPIEVTAGYNSQLSGGNVTMVIPTPTEAPRVTTPPEATKAPEEPTPPGEKETSNVTIAPTPTKGGSSGSSTAQTGGADGPGTGGAASGKQSSEKKFYVEAVAIIFVIPVLLLVKFLVVPMIRGVRTLRRNLAERRLCKKMKRIGNRRSIHLLNNKVYRRLRRIGRILKPHPSDMEYEAVLKRYRKEIPEGDWERYMKLAKEAAFSYNEFSDEEVAFCYEMYQKVMYKFKNNDDDEDE